MEEEEALSAYDHPVPCAADCVSLPMHALADEDGTCVDPGLPSVVDAHVHLFPNRLFEAIWQWFETHGWPIRYKLYAHDVVAFLKARGVTHAVALHYAHKPGIARSMNAFMGALCKDEPFLTGTATVCPGEPEAGAILREGFALGLRGAKLHCHVQSFAPDDPRLDEVYDACASANVPLVIHAGREPTSKAYKVDPYALCSADRLEAVLRNFPTLRICVPHLGADEFDAYERLLGKYDTLWLDTTMMLAGYFPLNIPNRLVEARPERLLYGTDFPNLPYAWDRELKRLGTYGVKDEWLPAVLGENAKRLFGIV
jgi:uncharacterized protein